MEPVNGINKQFSATLYDLNWGRDGQLQIINWCLDINKSRSPSFRNRDLSDHRPPRWMMGNSWENVSSSTSAAGGCAAYCSAIFPCSRLMHAGLQRTRSLHQYKLKQSAKSCYFPLFIVSVLNVKKTHITRIFISAVIKSFPLWRSHFRVDRQNGLQTMDRHKLCLTLGQK